MQKSEWHESFRNRVSGVGGNGRVCSLVLLPSSFTASGRSDDRCRALGAVRRANQRIAGHRCECVGVFRRRLDDVSKNRCKVS